MFMKLNVFVNKRKIGTLEEISPDPLGNNPNPRILFEYIDDADPSDRISLLMPVSNKRFIYHEIPPIFDMILPEGKRRASISQLAKITRIDDMGLLSLVGYNTIGRNQICKGNNIAAIPEINIDEFKCCNDGQKLFQELLLKSGFHSGVAGIQPKVLVSKSNKEDKIRTINTSTHIIKSFDMDDFPWLTVNEFFCLRAAKMAGIDVPEFTLSNDGYLLAIERFDLKDEKNGIHFGFEEILSLLGRKSGDKYIGSVEEIVNCIDDHIDISRSIQSLHSVFRQTVFNTLIGNGDAHLKNFGLLYDEKSVRLSPAYDIVCTKAYIKNDIPALALEYNNFSKKWWSKDELIKFGEKHCYMTSENVDSIYTQALLAMKSVINDINKYINDHPEFSAIGKEIISIWQVSICDQSTLLVDEVGVMVSARIEGEGAGDEDETKGLK